MTLEDLRKEFNRLQAIRLGDRYRGDSPERVIEEWASDPNWDDWTDEFGDDPDICRRMSVAAKCYVIARDQGVKAAVLFKLTHGG